ncbi:MAG: alpha/beta hydrolase [Spirochaetes bacterium]|nr:alpha/beta hydrolase [Spirochaetota bacterium]
MKTEIFQFEASDGVELFVRAWLPEGAPKACVLVAHGVADHGARYERFAKVLVGSGYAVYAPDHRGHGQTAKTAADRGYFSDGDGFRRVVDDLRELARSIKSKSGGAKLFLFGHSLGSILARYFIALDSGDLAGCILSGPADGGGGLLVAIGGFLAGIGCLFRGRRAPAPFLDKMVLGSNLKPFEPARTKLDWLSRDTAEVDKYIADPLCGFVCSCGFFADGAKGTRFANRSAASISRTLPIYLFAGSKDSLGAARGFVDRLVAEYRAAGIADVESKLYPDGRHEMLNETNRDEVMRDIVAWLGRH